MMKHNKAYIMCITAGTYFMTKYLQITTYVYHRFQQLYLSIICLTYSLHDQKYVSANISWQAHSSMDYWKNILQ